MNKKIIIDANFSNDTRVVLLNNNNNIENIEYETASIQQKKGNIYLAKVTRIEPSLQAAFIDYGGDKSGFLPFGEIHSGYYHIPVSDQKFSISSFKEIAPPQITSDDIAEDSKSVKYHPVIDSEDIDLQAMEKLVDQKIQSEFDIEVSEVDIETINNEKPDSNKQNQYKIQEVMKKGQVMLVQATKEERGNKGASFTTYISLAGKYCVLMPNRSSQNGVSRKISNTDERRRLKNIISQITADGSSASASVIIRTAGVGRTSLQIKRDFDYLVRLWNKIRSTTLNSTAPSFIHEEEGIIQKTIRDMFDHNVKEVLVQGGEAYKNAAKFMQDILPDEVGRVKEYKNKTPIFTKFVVEDQIANLYKPIVSLPSGGYIVINPTEALISIDVNSGKATSERNIEETALKTNLEAAKEIARQIKLRDLSGLLVIDFIDMAGARNRKIIERSFREFLSRDRARIQTSPISNFGLLEMSRQRLRPSFLESNSTMCSHCSGKGVVRADESNSMLMLRTIENEIFNEHVDVVNIYASAFSVVYLLNNKRSEIAFIEDKYGIKLNFNVDPNATSDVFSIEKIRTSRKSPHKLLQAPVLQNTSENYQQEESGSKNKKKWKGFKESPAVEKSRDLSESLPNEAQEEAKGDVILQNNSEADNVEINEIQTEDDIAIEGKEEKKSNNRRKRITRKKSKKPINQQ